MNTKNKIVAILMASIVAMAVGMPMAMGGTATTNASVNNLAPSVAITSITPSVNPGDNVTVSGTVSDPNGLDDVNSSLDWSMTGPGTNQSGTVSKGASWSFTITTSAVDPPGTYTVTVTAGDSQGNTDSDSDTYVVNTKVAFSIDFDAIGYGGIDPGNSSTVEGNTTMEPLGANPPTIQNDGNVVMDVNMSITGTIFPDHTTATVGTDGPRTLNAATTTFTDANIAVDSRKKIDSTLSVDTGTASGSYSGTLTVDGIQG